MNDAISDADLALLGAYLDQELSSEARAALQQRLLTEPALRAKLDELQQLNNDLKELLQPPEAEPLPESIQALLASEPQRKNQYSWPLSIAAGLLLAVSGLWLLQPQTNSNGANWQQIAQQLEHTPSLQKQQLDESTFIAVRSFQHQQGYYCREYFLQHEQQQEHGIACKQQGVWQKSTSYNKPLQSDQYQTASDNSTDPVSDYFNQYNQGGSLAVDVENQRLQQGW